MAKHDIDLLPHTINFKTGQPKEHARATSSSYILMFLSDIDKEWANYYYNNYMSTFKRSFLGFNLIREYPGDRDGKIDVDTGPIIFGFAATPTVTTAGVSRIHRDKEPFEKLITLQEFLGMRINDRYLLGTLLIFDGFNIWSKTAVNWNNDIDKSATQKSFWFIKPILYLIIGLITPIVTLNLALFLTKRKEI